MPFLWIQLTLVTMYFKPNVTKLQEVCMLKRCSELYCDTCMKFTLISRYMYCNLYSFTIMKWRNRLKPTHFLVFVCSFYICLGYSSAPGCLRCSGSSTSSYCYFKRWLCLPFKCFISYRITRSVQIIPPNKVSAVHRKFTNSQRGFADTVHLMQNLAARTS